MREAAAYGLLLLTCYCVGTFHAIGHSSIAGMCVSQRQCASCGDCNLLCGECARAAWALQLCCGACGRRGFGS